MPTLSSQVATKKKLVDSDPLIANGQGSANCKQQREALMACVARRKAAEAAKTQQAHPLPAGNVQDQAQEASPAGAQQGWPEKGWEQSFDGSDGQDADNEGKAKW